MKQLLQDIEKRLTDAKMPEGYKRPRKNDRLFEYVDLDWGQVDFFAGEYPPPVKFPCALIDILNGAYTDEGRKAQVGVVDIQVRIVDMVLSNSSGRAPESQKERAYAVFDLLSNTHALLQGWTGSGLPKPVTPPQSGYGPLTRTGMTKINRADGLKEYRITYRVQLDDYSAVVVPKTIKVQPVIEAEMI